MVTVQKSLLWVNCHDQVIKVCLCRKAAVVIETHKICKHTNHAKHNTQSSGICKTSWRGGVGIPLGLLGGFPGRLLEG